MADHLRLEFHQADDLGENDRSATGFLPSQEFEKAADNFFANPRASVRGWETAEAAQRRIVRAITDRTPGNIVVVSHGAVGTLLYCDLAGEQISRRRDQPSNGGGNFFSFQVAMWKPEHWWRAFDDLSAA